MSIASFVVLTLKASIVILVFAIGMHATLADTAELLRRRGLLVRSLLSLNVLMLVFAVALVQMFALPTPAKVALLALSVSPIPPLLPKKLKGVHGAEPYTASLIVFAALLSIVIVPASMDILGAYFHQDVHVPPSRLVPIVLVVILVPLLLGMLVNKLFPSFAKRFATPIGKLGSILLALSAAALLVSQWKPLFSMFGSGVMIVLTIFSVVGAMVGHLLGGPEPENREVLALATSVRHPGIAITIAAINFPDEKSVPLVVVWHLIIGTVVAIVYKALFARQGAR